MLRIAFPLLMLVALSGCFSLKPRLPDDPYEDCQPPPIAGRYLYLRKIDNLVTCCTAQKCAKQDLKQIKRQCGGKFSKEYKDGYTQAYIDLAFGRPPCEPPVPPQRFWHACYRSCEGRPAIDEWFAGYRDGLDNGMNGCVSKFNRIVPNADGCCVSAAYVSPYASALPPKVAQPTHGQTLTQRSAQDSSGIVPAGGPAGESPTATPPLQNVNAIFDVR